MKNSSRVSHKSWEITQDFLIFLYMRVNLKFLKKDERLLRTDGVTLPDHGERVAQLANGAVVAMW